jgi:hypothetical protein
MSEDDQKWNILNKENPIPPDAWVVVRIDTALAPVFKATIRLKSALPQEYLDLKTLYTMHRFHDAEIFNPTFLDTLDECKFNYTTCSKSLLGTLKITEWRFLAEPSNLTITCDL